MSASGPEHEPLPAEGVSPRSGKGEHAFLVQLAELLHAYGTPAHRLERVLQTMATSLGVEAQFLSTPTSVFASFGRGSEKRVHLLRIEPGEVDLGKLVEFDQVMEDVEHRRIDVALGKARLEAVAAAPPRYSPLATALAYGVASGGAARFFGGGAAEVAASFALGLGIFALGRRLSRGPAAVGVLEPLAAFLAALLSSFLAHRVALDDRVVTLASLIVLVPGLTLTVAMTELATRHLVSGVARLAGAGVVFLTLLLGVALAWRLSEGFLGPAPHATPVPLPGWTEWLALALAPVAFGVLLSARPKELVVVWATGVAGYLCASFGASALGADLGPFLGALVVGIASNLYARVADRPALVPSTPGILLLVPGSLGYRSLTSFLDREALVGVEWAFQTGLVAVSLVGGLLAANLVLPPRRVL